MALGRDLADDANPGVTKVNINSQTGTTYTLTASDNGKVIELDNAAAITVTVPLESSEDLGSGFNCVLVQKGAGLVTVAGEGAVTVDETNSDLDLAGQYGSALIYKTGTDSFVMSKSGAGTAGAAGANGTDGVDGTAGGAWEFVEKITLSGTSHAITMDGTEGMIMLAGVDIQTAGATAADIAVRFNSDSGTNYVSSRMHDASNAASGHVQNPNTTECVVCNGPNNTTGRTGSFIATIRLAADADSVSSDSVLFYGDTSGHMEHDQWSTVWKTGGATSAHIVNASAAENMSGDVYVYKLRKTLDSSAAHAYADSAQAVANATEVYINLNKEDFDTDNYHDNATNNSRLTVPTTGTYMVSAYCSLDANTTGRRILHIEVNRDSAKRYCAVNHSAPSAGTARLSTSAILNLTANDYVEMVMYQDSGVSLNTAVGTADSRPRLMIHKV